MLHAYRLASSFSPYTLPHLWEYAQPYIDHLIQNARTFDRRVVQGYFADWHALAADNTSLSDTYYRSTPRFAHCCTWQEWLPEYRQLILAVQEVYEAHTARRTLRQLTETLGNPKECSCHLVSNPTFLTELFLTLSVPS